MLFLYMLCRFYSYMYFLISPNLFLCNVISLYELLPSETENIPPTPISPILKETAFCFRASKRESGAPGSSPGSNSKFLCEIFWGCFTTELCLACSRCLASIFWMNHCFMPTLALLSWFITGIHYCLVIKFLSF